MRLSEIASAWRRSENQARSLPEISAVIKSVGMAVRGPGQATLVFKRATFSHGTQRSLGLGDIIIVLLCNSEPLVLRVLWRGISPQGRLNCAAVNDIAATWCASSRAFVQSQCLALDGFRADLAQLEALRAYGESNADGGLEDGFPTLDALLAVCPTRMTDSHPPSCVQGFAPELSRLSDEQGAVVRSVAAWAGPPSERGPRTVLVKGVFGSGKSSTLAACVLALDRILSTRKDSRRILLVCQTNIAVDNVLSNLMAHGWDNFARLGSFRSVDPRFLHRTVSLMTTRQAAAAELSEAMVRLPPEFSGPLRAAVDRGVLPPRRVAWTKRRLVAATAAALEAAEHLGAEAVQCALCFVDEAAQFTEPATLACLSRSAANRVLLVGDWRQLPPRAKSVELRRSLLERLWDHAPAATRVELTTQYRCHPAIAELAGRLFYEGRLRSGVPAESRSPVLGVSAPPLAALVLTAGVGSSEERVGQSFCFPAEARAAATWATQALALGIRPGDLGIICLYRPQAEACAAALTAAGVRGVEAATVDAFQGGERQAILLSCGRSSAVARQDTFAACPRRLNVALSRACRHLIVLGTGAFLESHPFLRELLTTAQRGGAMYSAIG